MSDNKSVKKAQKKNQSNQKSRLKNIKVQKREAGALGIGKIKFATKSAEGTTGGGRKEKMKDVTTVTRYKRPKIEVRRRESASVKKARLKEERKGVKTTTTIGTGKYKSIPFKKKKNA